MIHRKSEAKCIVFGGWSAVMMFPALDKKIQIFTVCAGIFPVCRKLVPAHAGNTCLLHIKRDAINLTLGTSLLKSFISFGTCQLCEPLSTCMKVQYMYLKTLVVSYSCTWTDQGSKMITKHMLTGEQVPTLLRQERDLLHNTCLLQGWHKCTPATQEIDFETPPVWTQQPVRTTSYYPLCGHSQVSVWNRVSKLDKWLESKRLVGWFW